MEHGSQFFRSEYRLGGWTLRLAFLVPSLALYREIRRHCLKISVRGSNSWGERFSLPQNRPHGLWGSPNFLFIGYRGYIRGSEVAGERIDCLPPSNAGVKNEWNCKREPPIHLHVVDKYNILCFALEDMTAFSHTISYSYFAAIIPFYKFSR